MPKWWGKSRCALELCVNQTLLLLMCQLWPTCYTSCYTWVMAGAGGARCDPNATPDTWHLVDVVAANVALIKRHLSQSDSLWAVAAAGTGMSESFVGGDLLVLPSKLKRKIWPSSAVLDLNRDRSLGCVEVSDEVIEDVVELIAKQH